MAGILFYIARLTSLLVLLVVIYAAVLFMLHSWYPDMVLPLDLSESSGTFHIYYPFSRQTFLLGDYNGDYLFSYFFTVAFYGLFLWLLADVFQAFRQVKLFTQKGVKRLSRFYLVNFLVPLLFFGFMLFFGQAFTEVLRITLLHLVIGVFAFFMAAIFRQGYVLQEEQDLTF
jgi:hypothetical protein